MTRTPVYRALPRGSLRTYAGLRYHAEHSSQEELAAFVRVAGAPVARYPATAVIAAEGAFRTGQDEVLERILRAAEDRFPEQAAFYRLRGLLIAFQGQHAQGLELVRRARLLDPRSTAAANDDVRLTYMVEGAAAADQRALEVLSRFPNTGSVWWAVAKECRTGEQYERLAEVWRTRASDPDDVISVVRQLATAAGRAGLTEEAIAWFRRAFEQILECGASPAVVRDAKLEGKGAWAAIEDLVEVLEPTGIPYFFAAGTALGLIREGRPLALDGDIDVGIRDADYDLEHLRELFRRHPRFEFDVVHPSTKKLGLKHRGGSPVDLFRFYEEGGRWWHDAVFVRWHNTPFDIAPRRVGGVSAPLPADPESYLTENYGDDWQVPNPAFDAFTDDAPNVEVTWPEYHRLHLVRRAFKAVSAGAWSEATRLLRQADEGELVRRIGARDA